LKGGLIQVVEMLEVVWSSRF